MKLSFRTVIIATLLFTQSLNAQVDSLSQFMFLDNGFDILWNPNSLRINGDAEIGSNSLNSTMFSDYLLRDKFTPNAKEQFVDLENERTNIAVLSNLDVEYKLSSKIRVYASSISQIYFTGSGDLSKLLLFGNAQFAGKDIASTSTNFLNSTSHTLGISHLIAKKEKFWIKGRYGINVITQFDEIESSELSVFTHEDGEYIDVSMSELSYIEKSNGVAGLGLDLDLFLGFNVNSSSSILIELTNVQPAYLLSRNEINIDTSFRFEGIEFNPFSTDSSQSFDNFVDSNLNQVTRNYKNRTFALLPSNLRFSWTKLLNLKNRVSVQLSTTQFGKYGYRASLSHGYLFGPKFKIRSTVAFGNYSSFQWNEAIEYRANEKVNLFASAVGLNAMLSPNLSHSYGISIGISNCF